MHGSSQKVIRTVLHAYTKISKLFFQCFFLFHFVSLFSFLGCSKSVAALQDSLGKSAHSELALFALYLSAGQSVISRKPTTGRAGMGSARAPSCDACGGCQDETLTSDHRWTEHRTSDCSSAFTRMTIPTAHCTRTSSVLFRMMNH